MKTTPTLAAELEDQRWIDEGNHLLTGLQVVVEFDCYPPPILRVKKGRPISIYTSRNEFIRLRRVR